MAIAPGTPAPEFSLRRADGAAFTDADLEGRTTVLVFFPFAFTPVCNDQLSVYDQVLDEFTQRGATLYAVSCDAGPSQQAFRTHLGVEIEMLSDFEPKGAASRAFGTYFEPTGVSNRALVVTGPDGVVAWSWEGEHPGILPGVNLVFDGLAAVSA